MWPSGFTLAMTLTLNFQGQMWNLLYLSQKWSDCHETKSKDIDWTPGLKCDLDHNLDLWNLKDLDLWPHTWPWPWIFMVKFWNSCISEWEGRLTLHKGCGSRSFMTMNVTIWWLMSGVWIYQIVTGVTSVVGVPSTHLVLGCRCHLNFGMSFVVGSAAQHAVFETQSKSCRSSSWMQIINIRLKKNQQKVPGPPPKLSASDRRACGNFQHCQHVKSFSCVALKHNFRLNQVLSSMRKKFQLCLPRADSRFAP